MPWYKTGTVSVTQNSNAVIGTGTAFIANSRGGDGFRGPDGRWYEVTNIASNTALSISPDYEGPTVTGGLYSIMPVQGYQKDLSDKVREILNDYGETLAALGTTGNYDILPVAKGGTGSADAAAARLALSAAKSGANNDITSLNNLTTPLSVAQGGTGTNSGVPVMVGATTTVAGTKGLVPAPPIADKEKFLKGDGSWQHAGLGMGQAWTDVTSSRALTTGYTNSTNRSIAVSGWVVQGTAGFLSCIVGSLTILRLTTSATGVNTLNFSFIVPPGTTYAVSITSGTATLGAWLELR
jgi:hypothetical protein